LAQRAREERVGIAPSRPAAETQATMKSSLAADGGDSGSSSGDGSEEEEATEVRAEKRREHEREMRMINMGTEQRVETLPHNKTAIYRKRLCWVSQSRHYQRRPCSTHRRT
jgi:SNW domain-containing protein 1